MSKLFQIPSFNIQELIRLFNKNQIGIDVGLEYFCTDSKANTVENPRLLRKSERRLKKLQCRFSKTKKGSNRRIKAQKRLALKHLQVSR